MESRVDTGYDLPLMSPSSRRRRVVLATVMTLVAAVDAAQAYIGPGAGFAVGGAIITVLVAWVSTLLALLLWPFRLLRRMLRRRRRPAQARARRVIILGLDGLEPSLVERYVSERRLPHIAALAAEGAFSRLATTAPPLSPVAWSSFLTGTNPGKHGIFDFLTRDKRSYLPLLSSVQILPPRRALRWGKWTLPLGPARLRLLRKGKPFWHALAEHGVFCNILRVPITFPVERFDGLLLAAMCVPDLRGSQGTFSFYSTRAGDHDAPIGGEQIRVQVHNGTVAAELLGPPNPLSPDGAPLRCPFRVTLNGADGALLHVGGDRIALRRGVYSAWTRVTFRAGPLIRVSGVCQFLLVRGGADFALYVTPINIDPERPALPISHPPDYAVYLAKQGGPYATLGLAEDTWGLSAGLLSDRAFLEQCEQADAERERMFFDALQKTREGLVVCVFDGPDRIQHMYWRYLEPDHPAAAPSAPREDAAADAIERMYERMDALVGRTRAQCGPDDVLLVMSDHGFNSFRRGVDLNVWLEQNGYLKLRADAPREEKYLRSVDWSQTRAYCLGLAGVWLNVAGRESRGIVPPEQAAALSDEIAGKLAGLRDEARGQVAVQRAFASRNLYRGPYREDAPDLIVAYNRGYRVAWEAAVGQLTGAVFHDNVKAWSGDHCIDPRLIPGVLLCNRKLRLDAPHLVDISATVLKLFGVEPPAHLDGRAFAVASAEGVFEEAAAGTADRAAPRGSPGSRRAQPTEVRT